METRGLNIDLQFDEITVDSVMDMMTSAAKTAIEGELMKQALEAAVDVAIPYTPEGTEKANTDKIIVQYIDDKGVATPMPDSIYDPSTGSVEFSTTHFSKYAISYCDCVHVYKMSTFIPYAVLQWSACFLFLEEAAEVMYALKAYHH